MIVNAKAGEKTVAFNKTGGIDLQGGAISQQETFWNLDAVKVVPWKYKPITEIQVGDNLNGAWVVFNKCPIWYMPELDHLPDPTKQPSDVQIGITNPAVFGSPTIGQWAKGTMKNVIPRIDLSDGSYIQASVRPDSTDEDNNIITIDFTCAPQSHLSLNTTIIQDIIEPWDKRCTIAWAALPIICVGPDTVVTSTHDWKEVDALDTSDQNWAFKRCCFICWTERDEVTVGDEEAIVNLIGATANPHYNRKKMALLEELEAQNTALLARIAEVETDVRNFKADVSAKVLDTSKRKLTNLPFTCTDPLGGRFEIGQWSSGGGFTGSVVEINGPSGSYTVANVSGSFNNAVTVNLNQNDVLSIDSSSAQNTYYTPYMAKPR